MEGALGRAPAPQLLRHRHWIQKSGLISLLNEQTLAQPSGQLSHFQAVGESVMNDDAFAWR
jgi:hypothetical protein